LEKTLKYFFLRPLRGMLKLRSPPPYRKPLWQVVQANTTGCANYLPTQTVPHRLYRLRVGTGDGIYKVFFVVYPQVRVHAIRPRQTHRFETPIRAPPIADHRSPRSDVLFDQRPKASAIASLDVKESLFASSTRCPLPFFACANNKAKNLKIK
jgi:hypothetical protein